MLGPGGWQSRIPSAGAPFGSLVQFLMTIPFVRFGTNVLSARCASDGAKRRTLQKRVGFVPV